MAFELTPRQMRTVAAAVTTVAAVVILIAAGLLGWLIVLFVRTFSGVFLPLVVGGIAALVFRPYYDWLRGPGRMPVAGAVAVVFLSALVPLAAFTAFFGHLAVRQLLGLAEQAPELWGAVSHIGRGDAAARRRGARYVGRRRTAAGDRVGAADHGGGMVAGRRVTRGPGRFRFRAWVQRPAFVGDHADLLRLLPDCHPQAVVRRRSPAAVSQAGHT